MKEHGYKQQSGQIQDSAPALVSVVMAVYNGEKYLAQTLDSILEQTYRPIEIIVLDGGSTDGTLGILKSYSDRIRYWKSEPDNGIYSAWNKALKLAKGEWISFVGADDILLPDAIAQYIDHIKAAAIPNLQFVSSKVQFVTNDLRVRTIFGRKWEWNSHKKEMRVAHVGALHHRSLFVRYGSFDESYKIAGDYEFLMRPKDKLITAFVDHITVLMRCEGTSNANTKVFKEVLRAKVITAKRNRLVCSLEYVYMLSKYYLLKIIRS